MRQSWSKQDDQQLRVLIAAQRENRLDAHGANRLNEVLKHNNEAVETYVRFAMLQSGLELEFGLGGKAAAVALSELNGIPGEAPSNVVDERPLASPSMSNGQAAKQRTGWSSGTSFRAARYWRFIAQTVRTGHESTGARLSLSFVVSALVVGSMLVLMAFWAAPSFRSWRSQRAVVSERPAATVARLTGVVDVAWAPGTRTRTPGDPVPQDEPIVLTSGLIEIQFVKGTKVLVEGPATFIARDRNQGYLSRGKLVAQVPRRANGFKLQTPQATIVDLGTEFGVEVDESGKTDVHVFQGNVLAELNGAETADRTVSRVLAANESARFDTANATIDVAASTAVVRQQFVRTLPRQRPKPKQGVTKNLVLINPSFELPDIRKHRKYSVHSATLQLTAYGWHTGTSPLNSSDQAYYVLSTKDGTYANGQGATDGQQVVSLCLRNMREHLPDDALSAVWMYQSLGVIDRSDVDRQLTAAVDVAVKDRTHSSPGARFAGGGATVELAFAVGVSHRLSGDAVGSAGRRLSFLREDGIRTLDASLTIPEEMIGRELFLRIAVSEPKPNTGHGTYHIDNVRCAVDQIPNNEPNSLEGERSPK